MVIVKMPSAVFRIFLCPFLTKSDANVRFWISWKLQHEVGVSQYFNVIISSMNNTDTERGGRVNQQRIVIWKT